MADIFISYTSSDRDWAFWIGKELEALGHVPHVHEWEIGGGEDIYAWMEHRHDAADHVLCVVSDAYLKAPYSTLERNAAAWKAAKQAPSFTLFVAVKPCKMPALTDHMRRCELFGLPEDAARIRFHEFMTARTAPAAVAFPGTSFAVSNIPIGVPLHFMGRDEPLAAIAEALARYEGRVAITALHGLRGVGKTTLAAAYAEQHRADYRATWWVRAQTEPTMRTDLVALGVRLQWVEPDAKEDAALVSVMERLRYEGEGILLIYDNAVDADSLKPYLPHGGGARILVTSNAPTWRGLAKPVEIRLWPASIGAEYLIARTGRESERAAAESLAEALGGLPLAHEQAAAYCERLKVGFAEYAKRFAATPAKFLDDEKHTPIEHNDGLTVAKSFALAIEEASKLHPSAEPLIIHTALLAPEPIPLFLFSEGREHFGTPLAEQLAEEGLDEALAALEAFALIERETIPDERDPSITTDTIRLHRLVREVAALRCPSDDRDTARGSLVQVLASAFPSIVWRNPSTWPRIRRLDALASAFVASRAEIPSGVDINVAHLMTCLGQYRDVVLTDYAGAKPFYEGALAIREKVLGPEHADTCESLNNLAMLIQTQGDLTDARPLFERALAARETALGPNHPDTARSLAHLASLLRTQGDLAGARPLFERAVTIFEKGLGPDHPDIAQSLNNLAWLLQAQGDLNAARPLFERALAIYEKALGPDHPHTAASLTNLASLLQAEGDLTNALPLQERAIAINEKVLGFDHPETATTYSNLARLLRDLKDFEKAEALFAKAIAIGAKALGTDHALTQRYRSHYARLLLSTERSAEAKEVAEAALAVHAAQSGPNHPWTKDSARVLADVLDALGETEKAQTLAAQYLA